MGGGLGVEEVERGWGEGLRNEFMNPCVVTGGGPCIRRLDSNNLTCTWQFSKPF